MQYVSTYIILNFSSLEYTYIIYTAKYIIRQSATFLESHPALSLLRKNYG